MPEQIEPLRNDEIIDSVHQTIIKKLDHYSKKLKEPDYQDFHVYCDIEIQKQNEKLNFLFSNGYFKKID